MSCAHIAHNCSWTGIRTCRRQVVQGLGRPRVVLLRRCWIRSWRLDAAHSWPRTGRRALSRLRPSAQATADAKLPSKNDGDASEKRIQILRSRDSSSSSGGAMSYAGTSLRPAWASIHPTAVVHPDVILGEGVDVGPFCTVGVEGRLRDGCIIHAHSQIFEDIFGARCLTYTSVAFVTGFCVSGAVVGADIQGHTIIENNKAIGNHAVRVDGRKTPEWVKKVRRHRTPNRVSSQSTSFFYGKGKTRVHQLSEVKAIHAHMIESGKKFQLFHTNTLMDMYVKCGSLADARRVFDNMLKRNVVSWNVMILGYAKEEEGEMALELYARMQQEGIQPTERTFVSALRACSSLASLEEGTEVDGQLVKIGCLEKGKAIHSQMVKEGFGFNAFLGTSLVDMYVKCASIMDAMSIFHALPCRDVIVWNAMISGHAAKEAGEVALQLYTQMYHEGVSPDDRTFVFTLKACSDLATLEEEVQVDGKALKIDCLEKGRAIHYQAVKSGYESNVFVGNTLMDMYTKTGSMVDAQCVFDKLPHRDVVSWNTIILGYAQGEGQVALQMYAKMQEEGVRPDDRTFVGALKACSSLAALKEGEHVECKAVKQCCLENGRRIHSQIVNSCFEWDVFVGTTLLDMYAKCGSMEDARHVFDKLPHRNVVSWTAMILGYAENNEGHPALQLYAGMRQDGVTPDDRTFVGVLKACSSLASLEDGTEIDGKFVKIQCLEKGRSIHSQVVSSGAQSDLFVGNTLIDMYANCGSIVDARRVFVNLPHRNEVSWNAMILGFAEQGESEEAFTFYRQMQEQGLSPNSWTFVSVLKACGNTAALEIGKEVHAQICRAGLESTALVATTLVDMYSKCGSMVDAQQLFDALSTRDLVTWNALISGYARQGESECVFHLFERMRQEGVQPDGVTFLSVLTVCSHVGLVNKGKQYFDAMSKDFGLSRSIQHYNCMVDLLGRAGQLDEAMVMMDSMPFQPNIVSWKTLLSACRKWNNLELGRHAFERAIGLDEEHAAAYVLMSNIYADARMWENRDKVQEMRKKSRAWKRPGQSWWTDVGGIVHTFVVGDMAHPEGREIDEKLKVLSAKMEKEGYVPHLDSVSGDLRDDEKENALCGHSEKLAIAYALLKTPPGTDIRIIKNLRVCEDCHSAIALISKIERRNIICRDATRFHDYKGGKCSCGNYW